MGRIAVTGSVAFDTIMVFPGRFADHVIPGQAHILNVSFLVERLERRRGGTAANIAYTLALLGERPLLCAAVGSDFAEYGRAISAVGVDTSSVLLCDDIVCATGFITTDADDNQITAFHPGAMARAAGVDLTVLGDVDHVLVTPDAPEAMTLHIAQAQQMGARLVFAPAQQLTTLDDATIVAGLDAAWLVIGNDYELESIRQRTGRAAADIASRALVYVTHGAQGSEVYAGGEVTEIAAVPPARFSDPTGGGDAYVAGVLAALRGGRSPEVAARTGALAATYAIEQLGTQSHSFTAAEFARRYQEAWQEPLVRPAG
ncbi:MAG: carbohydrate kinase family protein [Candidatus Dormibacteria bacterium]